jgi:teichuronic acid biosynthesis glycosyltransferase TuaC
VDERMRILYITSMNTNIKGGLFKATYERIIRHSNHNDCYVINNNYYDSRVFRILKKSIFKKDAVTLLGEKCFEKGLEINNLNFEKTTKYYIKSIQKMEKSFINEVIGYYIKKYRNILLKTDIIHAHWGYPNGYIAYKLSQKFNIPYFITFHGSDINNIKVKKIPLLIEAMENAEKCFFVSKQLLKNAMGLGYSGVNYEITYNGVDLNTFKIPDRNFKRNKVVGYIGALKEVKGADLLPEIFISIDKLSKEKTEFIVVGDGVLKNLIQNELRSTGLEVTYTGRIEPGDIPDILEKIDVLIVPSRNEGLGMVILEANAMGIPAVGTNIGGIPEAIEYEENLIEFDENMVNNMALRVVTILDNETNDSEIYRKIAINKFQWKYTIDIETFRYKEAFDNKNIT